jgi:hypothetical protein
MMEAFLKRGNATREKISSPTASGDQEVIAAEPPSKRAKVAEIPDSDQDSDDQSLETARESPPSTPGSHI